MLTDLQNQLSFYFYGDNNSNNPQKAPEKWEEAAFYDPSNDMTDDELAAWHEDHINRVKDPLFDVDF
jgi:hypothetical protein